MPVRGELELRAHLDDVVAGELDQARADDLALVAVERFVLEETRAADDISGERTGVDHPIGCHHILAVPRRDVLVPSELVDRVVGGGGPPVRDTHLSGGPVLAAERGVVVGQRG